MTRTITLVLDDLDYDAVQAEFARRQLCRDAHGVILPDGESNLSGALVAEMIRDLRDYRDLFEAQQGG